MRNWFTASADERFTLWLAEWDQVGRAGEIHAHLAVLDLLAGLLPDGPLSVLDELEMGATECGVQDAWQTLRRTFEADLWGQLSHLPPAYDALPVWYSELFHTMPLHYRRAAFLITFLDFMLIHLKQEYPGPFGPMREWLASVARWSHNVHRQHVDGERPVRRPVRLVAPVPPRSDVSLMRAVVAA